MKNNPMINYIFKLKGNPKICILTEPLWFIPFSLYAPFITVFMNSLGVNDLQIGLITTIGMIVQVFASFFGGVFTDKFGRRITTFIADLISWSTPCLVWAFAQNFWWFLAAAILNSVWQVSNISWGALLVEDSEPDDLVYAYSWINIASVLSVFVAPISFLLMDNFDTVLIVRVLYLFSFVSMTIKFLLLFIKGNETKQGLIRMQETKHVPVIKLIAGYKEVFLSVVKSPHMRFALFVMLVTNVTKSATDLFYGLYVTQELMLPTSSLAIFQMITAASMLIIMFTIQGKLNKKAYRLIMPIGYGLFIINNLLLILAPANKPEFIVLYAIISAVCTAFIAPRKDSLSARFVDKKERARVSAILYMLMIGITSPFGVFIGWLSSINRTLPFILNIAIFTVAFLAVMFSKSVKDLDKKLIQDN